MDIEAMLQSSDREERIAARRARVQARIAAQREGEQDGMKKEVSVEKEVGKGPRQMLASRQRIHKVRENYQDKVTNVRVEEDDRETRRRVDEEQRRQELRAKVLAEAEASARRNTTVAMGWTDVLNERTPQGLQTEIERQRAACAAIVASKDAIIDEIKGELKFKDDEYVKALKRQAEVIDSMIRHMAVQTTEVQQAVRDELEEVEAAFLFERGDVLRGHAEELNAMLEKRGKQEQSFMEAQLERADAFQQDLEELRVQDAEDYNILKVKLEKDIQNLEQHLEAMRATYQLNTEKLEYNYRVLVEREQENQSTISAQKRKVAQQRDILSTLKSKYTESERRFVSENTKLTEEYRRITEQFKDLQVKFKHFETADVTRHQEIWAMNGETVSELVANVLKADKVVHEQLLGLVHRQPVKETFRSPAEEAAEMMQQQQEQRGAALAGRGMAGRGADDEKENDEGADDEDEATARRQLLSRLSETKYASLLNALLDELPFMQLHAPGIEPLMATLGVTDGASFDALVEGLAKEGGIALASSSSDEEARGAAGSSGEGKDGGGELHHDDADTTTTTTAGPADTDVSVLEPTDALLRSLRQYLEKHGGKAGDALGKSQEKAHEKAQEKAQADREREYWQRMANVISAKMHRTWGVLKSELLKFSGVLSSRGELLSGLKDLADQNAELRDLLKKYLASAINEDLHIPPTSLLV